jgi:hypothetical protein
MAQGTHKGHHEPYAPTRPRVVERRTSTTPPQVSQVDRSIIFRDLSSDPSTHSLGGQVEGRELRGMGALLKLSGVFALSHGNAQVVRVRSDATVASSSALPPSLIIVVRQLGLWKGSSTYSRDRSYGHTRIRGLTDACYGGHDHRTTTANCTANSFQVSNPKTDTGYIST